MPCLLWNFLTIWYDDDVKAKFIIQASECRKLFLQSFFSQKRAHQRVFSAASEIPQMPYCMYQQFFQEPLEHSSKRPTNISRQLENREWTKTGTTKWLLNVNRTLWDLSRWLGVWALPRWRATQTSRMGGDSAFLYSKFPFTLHYRLAHSTGHVQKQAYKHLMFVVFN